MELTIKAGAKEIASLVLELQGGPSREISVMGALDTPAEREKISSEINGILLSQYRAARQQQQFCPREHIPSQGGEPQPD